MIAAGRTRWTLVALAFAAVLAACASRPAEHFYTVSAERSVPDPGAAAQRIVVSPIVIPALIDRPATRRAQRGARDRGYLRTTGGPSRSPWISRGRSSTICGSCAPSPTSWRPARHKAMGRNRFWTW